MQKKLKPWQIGLSIGVVVIVCTLLIQRQASQSSNAILPRDIPAGPLAATRTPQPDELVGLMLTDRNKR